jgi:hypothetical protein
MVGYGASGYYGRSARCSQVFQPSAVQTATGTGTLVDTQAEWSVALWQLEVTAAATAANDTLDVFIQTTVDGTNFIDIVHFAQVLGNGGTKRFLDRTLVDTTQAEFETGTALAASNVRHLFGDAYRVRWTIASGTAASFTFSVKANFLS